MIQRLNPGEDSPKISIRVSGDLNIQAWEKQEIEVDTESSSQPKVTQGGDGFSLSCGSDCSLSVPSKAQIRVERVGGNAEIKGVMGPLMVERVSGDFDLHRVNTAQVDHVGGDATINQVQGDLRIGRVSGDLSGTDLLAKADVDSVGGNCSLGVRSSTLNIRTVSGDLSLEGAHGVTINRVGGDLSIVNTEGKISIRHLSGDFSGKVLRGEVAVDGIGGDANLSGELSSVRLNAGGDIRLRMETPLSDNCSLRAGGDIRCEISPNLEADIDIISSGRDIVLQITGETEKIRTSKHHFTIGDGKLRFSLHAAGDVRLSTFGSDAVQGKVSTGQTPEDFSSLESRIEREVANSMTSVYTSPDITDKIQKQMQKAMEKAEARMEAAVEKLKQREGWLRGVDVSIQPEGAPTSPPEPAPVPGSFSPASEPVTDEERLIILRMVQDKKITIEQAEQLLQALDAQEQYPID